MGLLKLIKDTNDTLRTKQKEMEEFKEQCSRELNEFGYVEVNYRLSNANKINKFISFDLETTGLNARNDRIIEVSAVKFENGKPVDKFSSLIKQRKPIPPEIVKLTGITDQKLKRAPEMESVLWDFAKWLGDARTGKTILVAHNAEFDLKFLRHYFHLYGIPATMVYKDTLSMSRKKLPDIKDHKLGTVAEHFGIKLEHAHRAESDAETCGKIFIELLK